MPKMNKPRPEAGSADNPATVLQRLVAYGYLVRLNRPIGILLLMWPALWALWIAGEGKPQWTVVLIFILGVALMRSAGCAINDFADRKIDGKVERTRGRPLATGLVSPMEAVGIFVAISLMAFALVLFLRTYQTVGTDDVDGMLDRQARGIVVHGREAQGGKRAEASDRDIH